ncbi:T9SS type A sorting domain-containing protein [Flavobacterium rhizosphaerae]|uniref:T9SS type A sorting domain-containing protein n=1 Tax=Flavobacterium rhizosphaerae TaxID=3163298 RepID=A0ABW8YZH4_9FLAO
MKKTLLLSALLFAGGLTAQTTHMVNWFIGVTSSETVITIENGDTVKWMWDDTLPHTVTSQAGGAETFDSGTITGSGESYSHTFTVDGTTAYACNFHPSMQGSITVTTTGGIKDVKTTGFKAYPNPVTDMLTVTSDTFISSIEIFDINGKLVYKATAATPNVNIYMQNFTPGTYIIKAHAGDAIENITVIKQ